jgi:prepilin-type N-terminal cleavage/methylation domain-containing protein
MNAAPAKRAVGFTLVELLVALVIASVLGSAMVSFFATQMRFRSDTDLQAETHQGLVAALDALTRDIRLAGACLPTQPVFVPIANSNGTTDNITLRTGVMNATTACVQTTLASDANANTTTLSVLDLTGFTVNGRGYVGDQVNGELFTVAAKSGSTGAGTITTSQPVSRKYVAVSGVYALQERKYSLDNVTYGIPTLVRSIDGQPAVPVAAGIRNLLITYLLTQGCPNCATTNVPASNAIWNQVSEVVVTITAQSPQPLTTGALYIPQATTVSVQPRNLLAYRSG